jgi:hypothetical protein
MRNYNFIPHGVICATSIPRGNIGKVGNGGRHIYAVLMRTGGRSRCYDDDLPACCRFSSGKAVADVGERAAKPNAEMGSQRRGSSHVYGTAERNAQIAHDAQVDYASRSTTPDPASSRNR